MLAVNTKDASIWWEGCDSNTRTRMRTVLQTACFNHLHTRPYNVCLFQTVNVDSPLLLRLVFVCTSWSLLHFQLHQACRVHLTPVPILKNIISTVYCPLKLYLRYKTPTQ